MGLLVISSLLAAGVPALAIWLLELIVILIAVIAVAWVVFYFIAQAGVPAPVLPLIKLAVVIVALIALFILLSLLGLPPL